MKFKNPLEYIDNSIKRFFELINLLSKDRYNFLGIFMILLLCAIILFSALIPTMAPLSKNNIKNPKIFTGFIDSIKHTDSYRGGSGCTIKINGFSWHVLNNSGAAKFDIATTRFLYDLYGHGFNYKNDYEKFGMLFCEKMQLDFENKECLVLKFVERTILSEYGYCDGRKLVLKDDEFWNFLYFKRNLLIFFDFIFIFIFILIYYKLNKKYKSQKFNFNENTFN